MTLTPPQLAVVKQQTQANRGLQPKPLTCSLLHYPRLEKMSTVGGVSGEPLQNSLETQREFPREAKNMLPWCSEKNTR